MASKWRPSKGIVLPALVAFVVIVEILFLDRLGMERGATVAKQWTENLYFSTTASTWTSSSSHNSSFSEGEERCIERLEEADRVPYKRDFDKEPVYVTGSNKDWDTCSVGCEFGGTSNKKPDAQFGLPHEPGTASVLRSMESSRYYFENNIEQARRCVSTSC